MISLVYKSPVVFAHTPGCSGHALGVPKDVVFFLMCRGYAYRKLGRWSNAIADYQQSLALAPGNVKTYNNLGYSYAKGGDYDNAIQSYTTVRVLGVKL